jgi:hypothetical protein
MVKSGFDMASEEVSNMHKRRVNGKYRCRPRMEYFSSQRVGGLRSTAQPGRGRFQDLPEQWLNFIQTGSIFGLNYSNVPMDLQPILKKRPPEAAIILSRKDISKPIYKIDKIDGRRGSVITTTRFKKCFAHPRSPHVVIPSPKLRRFVQ